MFDKNSSYCQTSSVCLAWLTVIELQATGCTESTVLGPFHTDDAPETEHGGNIASKTAGKKLVIEGVVKDKNGVGIPGAQLDVWEADENGFYDVQNADRKGPDNRGIITRMALASTNSKRFCHGATQSR
ncbi:hypothetical protein H4Q26_003465 [Puccinia striiformis f. sp. tritici PST-130]|nr:hypothetical protein H4Q26_003465 [Puccinia striiformis f. sp. tritici PST-130]